MHRPLKSLTAASLICALLANAITQSKPASEATKAAQKAVLAALPFNDADDFKDVQRGFIAKPQTLTIKDGNGKVV